MTAFIYPNFLKTHSKSCTAQACEILRSIGFDLLLPDFARSEVDIGCCDFSAPEEAAKSCDIIISIGGDGTILKCAGLASKNSKPLLGINCGRLGFMASLERSELELLKRLSTGQYKLDERMMLSVSVIFEDDKLKTFTALNEAVISSESGRGIRDFTVLADGITVSSLRADGLIFSTPTGASAYSLSAGGPLIEPSLDCIEFTQICPHSLFARTMLFAPDKRIEIKFESDGNTNAALSVDGRPPIRLSERDRVIITRSNLRLKLIDIDERGGSYFKAINHKLMQPAKPGDINTEE